MVIAGFLAMRYNETRGHWPLMKASKKSDDDDAKLEVASDTSSELRRQDDVEMLGMDHTGKKSMTMVREMRREDSSSSGGVVTPERSRTIEIDA